MEALPWLLLALSATIASVKNILVKGLSGLSFKTREFFGIQALIFGAGSIVLLSVSLFNFSGISLFTLLLSLAYGTMLIGAQWFYVLALTKGKTAVCATIYSFGFVIPTLSGWLFWGEELSVFAIIGIIIVFPVLIISGTGKSDEGKEKGGKEYIIYLIIAMLCSGGLGIVQKVQQSSKYVGETSTFILLSFILGLIVSLIFFFTKKKGEGGKITKKSAGISALVGVCYSVCNLINTSLAGTMDSAIFFPAINIGSIVISMIFGMIIYKEKLNIRDIAVLCLGAVAIALVNL
jgi:drug/metabolite transporter (DMT)-like permease